MVDTIRLLSALQTLLADNGSGDISPQDLRDFLVTGVPTGRYVDQVVTSSTHAATTQLGVNGDRQPDATADDVEAQAAIDTLDATYGGLVKMTSGLFEFAAPAKFKTGTVIKGIGSSHAAPTTGTWIQTTNNPNYHAFQLNDADVKHFELWNVVIWGRRNVSSPSGTADCVNIDYTGSALSNAPRNKLINVQAYSCNGYGFRIIQPSGVGGGVCDLMLCFASGSVKAGYWLGGLDIFMSHCFSINNQEQGYVVDTNSGGLQMVNCKADSNGDGGVAATGQGLLIQGGSKHKIIGFEAIINGGVGIETDQQRETLHSIILNNNGSTSDSPGLKITANASEVDVILQAYDDRAGASRTMDYGVELVSGCDQVKLDGTVYNAKTGALNDGGATNLTNNLVNWT